MVQLDVVCPDAPQAGQDLGEGGHDQVLSVTEIVQKMFSVLENLRIVVSSSQKSRLLF